jgi:glycosyltransferase involved in cell wall biosynthesis
MDAPLFSVIIPTHDRQMLMSEAVESVLSQTIRDLECIVVDDASPEPVVVSADPRVRLVRRHVNGGPAAARNTGMSAAQGRYLAFLDDDELFTSDRLEFALDGLARAEIALCWRRSVDEAGDGDRILEGQAGARVIEGEIPHLGVTALSRHAVETFDERLRCCEDVEWWIRSAPGRTVATIPKFGCLVRRRPESYSRTVAAPRVDARLKIFEWHDDFFSRHDRAAAFQWRKLGFHARTSGNNLLARRAFAHSLRRRPSLRTCWHLLRALVTAAPRGPHIAPDPGGPSREHDTEPDAAGETTYSVGSHPNPEAATCEREHRPRKIDNDPRPDA